jgi:hypothetical protein
MFLSHSQGWMMKTPAPTNDASESFFTLQNNQDILEPQTMKIIVPAFAV